MNEDQLIDEFLDALAPATAAMDFRTFSEENISWTTYDPLIAEPWTRLRTLPMIETLENRGVTPRATAALLHNNASNIRSFFFFDLFLANCARAGVAAYRRIFRFYSDMLHALCLEDPFAKNGKNVIHKAELVTKMVGECKQANPDIARKLGRLANACYNLSYALYSDMNPQIVYENFGPYEQPDGRMFAVKIFHNLKPIELWPETASLPVENIDIGCLFEDVTLEVDYITHAIYKGDQINGLRGWWCVMDGRRVEDMEEIDRVRQAIEAMAVAVFTGWQALDTEARKKLYWHQKAWNYKKLFEHLGLDWKPPAEVIAAGRGKPLFQNWNFPENKDALIKVLRDIFDPRKEIPPEVFRA